MPNLDGPMSFDFSDAPGGDQNLDDLFNDTVATTTASPTTEPEPLTEPEPQPGPFLQTATGTVYNSAEEAVKGIEHKDALIARLRQEVAEKTGKDPIKQSSPQEEESYIADPKKYFADLQKAKTEQEMLAVQSRFIQENLAPYLPYVASAAKARAIDEVSTEVPEIHKFLRSEEYQKTLDSYPLLKQSVAIAESNPQAAVDLGQLYKMAHSMSLAMNLPKIVQTAARQTPETRPTVASTPTVVPTNSPTASRPSFSSPEGLKAIKAEQEAKGVLDLRF